MDPREWLFDRRVLRRNLDKGVLTWKSYQEYLKALSDQQEDAEALVLEGRQAGASAAPEGAGAGGGD